MQASEGLPGQDVGERSEKKKRFPEDGETEWLACSVAIGRIKEQNQSRVPCSPRFTQSLNECEQIRGEQVVKEMHYPR